MGGLAGMTLCYLSPMVFFRDKYDPNVGYVAVMFIGGFVLAVVAPLGDVSHPLFHLGLVPYAYAIANSAIRFECQQKREIVCNTMFGNDHVATLEKGKFWTCCAKGHSNDTSDEDSCSE